MKRIYYFLPFWLALILLIMFSSCAAHRAKICMTCPTKTVIKDSINYKTEYLPFDTLALISRHEGTESTFTDCDSLVKLLAANNNTITTKKDGVKSTIKLTPKGLSFKCETDSLLEIIHLLRIKETINKTHSEVIEVPKCDLEHISKMDSFFIIIGRAFCILLVVYLGYRVAKFYFKF